MLNSSNVLWGIFHCLPSSGLQVCACGCVCVSLCACVHACVYVSQWNDLFCHLHNLYYNNLHQPGALSSNKWANSHKLMCWSEQERKGRFGDFILFFFSSWYLLLSVSKPSDHSSNHAFNQSVNCPATQLINQLETQTVSQPHIKISVSRRHSSPVLIKLSWPWGMHGRRKMWKWELWNWVVSPL